MLSTHASQPLTNVERYRNGFSAFRTLSAPYDTRNNKKEIQTCKLFGRQQAYKKRGKKSHDYYTVG